MEGRGLNSEKLSPRQLSAAVMTGGLSAGAAFAGLADWRWLLLWTAVGTAIGLFVLFSALFGFTLSIYLYIYELGILAFCFLLTAVYFGALAAYGFLTGRDLSSLRVILFSSTIFLVIFGLLSMFIPGLVMFDRVICLVGIATFLGWTAYDTQKIKVYYNYYSVSPEMLAKASIFSALQLYLDFINLFLYLLRFLGNKRR